MSVKTDAIAILTNKKDEQVAAVGAVYDAMIEAINALPEDGDVATLQQQLADANAQIDSVKAALATDDSALADEKDKEAKLQAKLDAIKAALEA